MDAWQPNFRNYSVVQCILKAAARIHSQLSAHVVLWRRVVVFPQLHIPQIWHHKEEPHEVLIHGSMDEELPQAKALPDQPSCGQREAPLVHLLVLWRPVVELIKIQVPDPI